MVKIFKSNAVTDAKRFSKGDTKIFFSEKSKLAVTLVF